MRRILKQVKQAIKSSRLYLLYYTLQSSRRNANRVYKSIFGKDIDWKHPRNLIEKIYWLQLYSDTSLWTLCADKYRMRAYIQKKGCDSLLPKLLGQFPTGG